MVGPTAAAAAKAAQTIAGNKKCKKRAHDMAYERNGRYGQVTFSDGIRRWVVAGSDGEVFLSFPALQDPRRSTYMRSSRVDLASASAFRRSRPKKSRRC
jgi:hypothetical protein